MASLKFISTKNLKFLHNSEGVTINANNKRLILRGLSIIEKDVANDYSKLKQLAKINLKFQSEIGRLPQHVIESDEFYHSSSFSEISGPVYKYVNKSIYENFILNGQWQLGCINQYRKIENEKQRDEFEGFCNMNLLINDFLVNVLCHSGFNYLIFCCTKTSNSKYLKRQFGDLELKIPNVKSFANDVKKSISAKRVFIQEVKYNSLKSYFDPTPIFDTNVSLDDYILNESFVNLLLDRAPLPSLFVKPEYFKDEHEIRIIFEMGKDYKNPLRFHNKGLNSQIVVQ